MNYQKQLLKWLIENPSWLTKTQAALFSTEPNETRIFLTAQRILNTGKPISFDQLRYTLAKHEDLVQMVTYLENETSIDKATALQIREDLRQSAITQFIRRGANLDLTDPKTRKEYIKELNLLELNETPKELHIVSFNQFRQHISPPSQILDSGLSFLKDTGSDFELGHHVECIAPSNQFKSGILAHIARHQLAVGRNVLFFAMEELSHKFLSRIGHGLLKMTPYQYRQLGPDQLEQRFSTMQLGHLDCIVGTTVYAEDLIDLIEEEEEKRGYKYDYIIIDYSAQIKLKTSKKTNQEWQDLEKIFYELKQVSANPNNPKVLISAIQSNREGYKKKKSVGLDNASGSMGGVHSADIVLGLKYITNPNAVFRETPAEEQPDDVKGLVKIEVLKKREGTVEIGSKWIYNHLATGNIRVEKVDWKNQDEAQLWDNLFEDTDGTQNG